VVVPPTVEVDDGRQRVEEGCAQWWIVVYLSSSSLETGLSSLVEVVVEDLGGFGMRVVL